MVLSLSLSFLSFFLSFPLFLLLLPSINRVLIFEVILTDGSVYGCGDNRSGQLCRGYSDSVNGGRNMLEKGMVCQFAHANVV
jgi:hypothetical protein